ncbi:MAG: T9SS type A sorting domain-containing protein [Candidatus Competibacteraceae bacterium]|nr:T9SS type A sorting domain-containing protein [Candidatus Competibacteraceae bacterium]
MKKVIFTSGLLFSMSYLLPAQITITENDLPEAGFTYVVNNDTSTQVPLGTPGPSAQVWDYSMLASHYPKVPTYDSTINTPYAGDFPASSHYTYGPAMLYGTFHGGAPVGTQGMNNGYMFWRRDATGFWIEGFRADGGTFAGENVYYTPQELLIGAPATYGTVFNNTSRWQLWMNNNPADVDTLYTCTVTKTLTSDAHGDLIIPSGTFNNVLRIHEHAVKVDSVFAIFNSIVLYSMELSRDTSNNYMYYSNIVSYPLCIVHADGSNYINSTEHYVIKVPMSAEEEQTQAYQPVLYPNPASSVIQVKIPVALSDNKPCVISVYNLSGQQVLNVLSQGETTGIYTADLPAGLYVYTITNHKGNTTQGRFIIAR